MCGVSLYTQVHAVVWSVFVHSGTCCCVECLCTVAVMWSLFVVHSVHAVVWSVFVHSGT